MNHRLLAAAGLFALVLSGCAATPSTPPRLQAWTPGDAWWITARAAGGEFVAADGSIRRINARHAGNLREASRRIREQSGIEAAIALLDDDSLNAAAIDDGGERRIVLTLPFLAAIGDDLDALATSIGHEAAHLYYRHDATRRQRGGPVFGNATEIAGIIAINTSFSRYEEREADLKGMEWAVAAGFSPCGSARTLRLLAARSGGAARDRFRATHPGYRERIARANALSISLGGTGC